MVPAKAPAGMMRSRELSGLKPKDRMMMGTKVEIGAFAIIDRNAKRKISQNFVSVSSSSTWLDLKCVLRTPALLTRSRATAM